MWRDSSLVVLFLGALAELTSSASAAGLDVPLTITETAGVARQSEPITFGVPVPQRLVRGVERLRLLAPDAKLVPAAFRVVNRWWDDGSVQWVHGLFVTGGWAFYKNEGIIDTYITETSGDRRYWDIAMEGFRRQTGKQDATDRLKLFAQYFRNSQRFRWYLSEEARGPMAEAAANR